jgi:hypothetical protein
LIIGRSVRSIPKEGTGILPGPAIRKLTTCYNIRDLIKGANCLADVACNKWALNKVVKLDSKIVERRLSSI